MKRAESPTRRTGPATLPPRGILELQRRIGNAATVRLLRQHGTALHTPPTKPLPPLPTATPVVPTPVVPTPGPPAHGPTPTYPLPAVPVQLVDGATFLAGVGDRATHGTVLGVQGKRSSTLVRIAGLLTAAAAPLPTNGAAARLGVLQDIEESCLAWAKVHRGDKHRAAAATYVEGQAGAAHRAAVQLKAANPGLAQAGYDAATNKIVRKARAADIASALDKLGILIDLAVPAPGSKGEVEFEVDIPIPKTPGFLGFRFKAEGDRSDAEKLKCRLELSFTGGVHIPGGMGRAAGELGGFSEAQGRTSKEVMQLFSYGLYRRSRESLVSNAELTSLLWGRARGVKGWDRAETWAGAVEKHVMGEFGDAYVQSGAFARGVAEVGIPEVGKGKADLQAGIGKQWDAAGIKAIASAKSEWSDARQDDVVDELLKFAAPPSWRERSRVEAALATKGHVIPRSVLNEIIDGAAAAWDDAGIRAAMQPFTRVGQKRRGLNSPEPRAPLFHALASKAEDVVYVKSSGQVTAGIIKGDAKVEASWISRGRDRMVPIHFREGKIELKAGFYLPASKLLGTGLSAAFPFEKLASGLAELVKALPIKSSKMEKGQRAGVAAQAGTELTESVLQFASVPTDQFSMAFAQSNPMSQGLSVGSTIQLVLEAKLKGPKQPGADWPFELSIAVGEEQTLRAEAVVARAMAKTFNRWLRAGYKRGGEWKFDVFGRQLTVKP